MSTDKKIVMLGDSGVGKTSIVQRYVSNRFADEYRPTAGAQPLKKVVEHRGRTYKLVIWDVAGHLFRLHPAYSSDADGIVLVCGLDRIESAEGIMKWLKIIQSKIGDVPIVIAANKSDIHEMRKDCDKKLPEGITYIVTSAKTGSNIDALFDYLLDRICQD